MVEQGMHNTTRIVIVGASTNLMEILEVINDINAQAKHYEVIGALDDNADLHGQSVEGIPVLGGLSAAAKLEADVCFVFGIGSYALRLRRIEIFKAMGVSRDRFVTLIHPSAKVYSNATLGHGCIVYPGALIMARCRVGDFVIVFGNTIMAPLSRVDDFALFGSLVFLGSNSYVGSGAFLGSSCAVMEKTRIGPGAMIGIASVVLRDVEPGATMLGNPARMMEKTAVPEPLVEAWAKATSR
jgi:sugar O-acyltransferase (sialic acid O-acetyltransferase NeuD family)